MTRAVVQSLFPDIVREKYTGPLPQSVQQGTNADVVWNMRDVVDSMRTRFGVNVDGARSENDCLDLILAGLIEAARVTNRADGFLCVKCMDFVGSGRFCDWSYEVHKAAKTIGMHLYDEVIHNAGSGPGGHNISVAKRARRAHSKLLVFTWKSIR